MIRIGLSSTQRLSVPAVPPPARERIGSLDTPDGLGHVGNPYCGDAVNLYLRIASGRVVTARYEAIGCAGVLAAADALAALAEGLSVEAARDLRVEDLLTRLPGFPESSYPCAALALEALGMALADHASRRAA